MDLEVDKKKLTGGFLKRQNVNNSSQKSTWDKRTHTIYHSFLTNNKYFNKNSGKHKKILVSH